MPTTNSWNSQNPAQVAKGGTGIATTTAYAPICGGTTATAAFQTADTDIANSGYVLTSNGNAALPTWQAAGGGGISTINVDTGGGVTGSSVSLFALFPGGVGPINISGASVSFIAVSGTEINLNLSTGLSDTFLGSGSGVPLANSGGGNTSVGCDSLQSLDNSTSLANQNVAIGSFCCTEMTEGWFNTAVGSSSLMQLTEGNHNVCLGHSAGLSYTSSESSNILISNQGIVGESNVIRIGDSGSGYGQQNLCYIAGISGVTVAGGVAVLCDGAGNLGTVLSSARYKTEIEDLGSYTDILYKLRPVSFIYKTDQSKEKHYGLIAEEVSTFCPNLVVKDIEGRPDSVKYHEFTALLINEIQKLKKEIDSLKRQIYGSPS